jgi:Recombinase zinc beta ribbon domain
MNAHSRQHGKKRVFLYGCATYWKKGRSCCTNNLAARVEVLDAEVLDMLRDDILRSSVVEQAIALALDELTPKGNDRTRQARVAEIGIA